MSFEYMLIKIVALILAVAPVITFFVSLWDRIRKIIEASKIEAAAKRKQEETTERFITELKEQVSYLREQLDDCLDDSRKDSIWNKSS